MNTSFVDFLRWIGSGTKASAALGVSEATVSRWRNGQQVPVAKARQIETISRGIFSASAILGLASRADTSETGMRDAA